MFVAAKLLVLLGVIRLLAVTNRPLFCAGLYSSVAFLAGLMAGRPLLHALVASVLVLGLSSAYFMLLDHFDGNLAWWPICIVGFVIILL